MHNQPVDRPPVSFWQHAGADEQRGKASVEMHLRFMRETGVDFLKVMNDGYRAPFDTESIKTADDWYRLRPAYDKNPYIAEMLSRTRAIVDAVGSEVLVQLNIFAPLSLIRRVGDSMLMAHIEEDPDAVKHALQVIADEQAYLAREAVHTAGADGCVVCFQGAELNRFSTVDFDTYVRPYDMQVLNAANSVSDNNIVHFCGWDEWKNRFSCWRNYPARTVNWAIYVDGMDLVRGRDYFGGRAVMGGFDNRRKGLLQSENKRVVQEETRRIVSDYVEATGSTNGLLISADCSFPPSMDRQRFVWVREALEDAAR